MVGHQGLDAEYLVEARIQTPIALRAPIAEIDFKFWLDSAGLLGFRSYWLTAFLPNFLKAIMQLERKLKYGRHVLPIVRLLAITHKLIPKHYTWLALIAACSFGAMSGLGIFTFSYGGGASYLSNNPAACTNCHIMQAHFDSWQKSSHHAVAQCNDCHLPQPFLGKWFTKADNGLLHSWAFTTGEFHEPIQIKPRNRNVTQQACIECHGDFVHRMLPTESDSDMLNCIHCHYSVGHALH